MALQAVGFVDSLVTPQMGWNRVVASPEAELLASGYAYFANSYRFEQIPEGWSGAMSDYGGAGCGSRARRSPGLPVPSRVERRVW